MKALKLLIFIFFPHKLAVETSFYNSIRADREAKVCRMHGSERSQFFHEDRSSFHLSVPEELLVGLVP